MAVLASGLSPSAASALAADQPGACATTARTLNGTLGDGATYEIQVPANWNCTLFLYSHGYVAPGSKNPAVDVGDPVTGAWLLSHGYALAGSSYASTGWAIQQALPDQVNTLNVFDQQVGTPAQTIAWGHSLGGIITAGLIQVPGWFTPLSPEPAADDFAAQENNQFLWETQVDFPFGFALRAELEARAGGNPSWNTGVDYYRQLARSADRSEVLALYRAAGLSLRGDLARLENAPRVSADPSAVAYLAQNISFNGQISLPVLTMHTTGDGLVIPENEQAYASVVRRADDSRLLRQVFVSRAGHCAFTPAETITAVQTLLRRLATGRWDDEALEPGSLNAAAAGLGPADNIFPSGSQIVATPPVFVPFRPDRYLRPLDLPGGDKRGTR
jgi:hypothetical protein